MTVVIANKTKITVIALTRSSFSSVTFCLDLQLPADILIPVLEVLLYLDHKVAFVGAFDRRSCEVRFTRLLPCPRRC